MPDRGPARCTDAWGRVATVPGNGQLDLRLVLNDQIFR